MKLTWDGTRTTQLWDARLALWIVRPLQHSTVTPNHVTTLRLMLGLGAAALFASGDWPTLGAVLFSLSSFSDHLDGELARLSGKSTRFGHFYDLIADAIVTVLLFVSIGIGLQDTTLDGWSVPLGMLSGLAVATIFHLRNAMEHAFGKDAARQPSIAGFESEDVFYLLPLVGLLDGLLAFLVVASIGAPLATWVVARQYQRCGLNRAAASSRSSAANRAS